MSFFRFENLDRTTRRFMRAEFYDDLTVGRVELPERLNASGRIMFPVALEAAIERGDDATLSGALRDGGFVREWEEHRAQDGREVQRHVPWNAADVIAGQSFHLYYLRGLCRRAVVEKLPALEYYKAIENGKPHQTSFEHDHIGSKIDPKELRLNYRKIETISFLERLSLRIPAGENRGTVQEPGSAASPDSAPGGEGTLQQDV